MNRPRDHNQIDTVGLVRAARIFSNIVSPPVIFALLGLALSLKELPLGLAIIWAAIFGFWVSLAPILLVVYFLRTGRITDLHMNTSEERRIPYLASILGTIITLLILYLFNGPNLLQCLAVLSLAELTALAIINNFWLISIHTASIMAACLVAGIVFGFWASLLVLPIVLLVCWARLFLKRHTVTQVFAGLTLGAGLVLGLWGIGCFT